MVQPIGLGEPGIGGAYVAWCGRGGEDEVGGPLSMQHSSALKLNGSAVSILLLHAGGS